MLRGVLTGGGSFQLLLVTRNGRLDVATRALDKQYRDTDDEDRVPRMGIFWAVKGDPVRRGSHNRIEGSRVRRSHRPQPLHRTALLWSNRNEGWGQDLSSQGILLPPQAILD